MEIAETTDKQTVPMGAEVHDQEGQKARQRAFLRRRAAQFENSQTIRSHFNLCTDLQRQWNRNRRLRRLIAADRPKKQKNKKNDICKYFDDDNFDEDEFLYDFKHPSCNFFWYTLLPLMLVILLSCCVTLYQRGDSVSKFLERYSSQYQAIIHNKLNYCDRDMALDNMFKQIRTNVLNQDDALSQLERALANQSSFQSIALVGSSGVGKSLTMRLLLEQYPWVENVQSIAWNDFDLVDEESRYRTVWHMQSKLAHCGRNLFVIDNMAVCDMDYVSSINALILARPDIANGSTDVDLKQVTIIYIFNLNRMIKFDHYERQLAMLQELPQTTVINYRNLNVEDLDRCIRHEAELLDLNMDERFVEEMLNSIDVKISGCKAVRSKVLIYGKPNFQPELESEQEKEDKQKQQLNQENSAVNTD